VSDFRVSVTSGNTAGRVSVTSGNTAGRVSVTSGNTAGRVTGQSSDAAYNSLSVDCRQCLAYCLLVAALAAVLQQIGFFTLSF